MLDAKVDVSSFGRVLGRLTLGDANERTSPFPLLRELMRLTQKSRSSATSAKVVTPRRGALADQFEIVGQISTARGSALRSSQDPVIRKR